MDPFGYSTEHPGAPHRGVFSALRVLIPRSPLVQLGVLPGTTVLSLVSKSCLASSPVLLLQASLLHVEKRWGEWGMHAEQSVGIVPSF